MYIDIPAPGFPIGSYCYKCLVRRCALSHRIPLPMEQDLLDSIERDLGLDPGPGKKFYFLGDRAIPGSEKVFPQNEREPRRT